MNNFIEKEKRGELVNILKYPYNAIKHAITEQEALSVHRDLAVSVIMIAIIELSQISELSFYQKMFVGYVSVKHPDGTKIVKRTHILSIGYMIISPYFMNLLRLFRYSG